MKYVAQIGIDFLLVLVKARFGERGSAGIGVKVGVEI